MLTQEQVKKIADLYAAEFYLSDTDYDISEDLYNDLYEYFLSTNEMPYGIAKARTGDPDQWIHERLIQLGERAVYAHIV
jgi:hypothetical protein